MHITFQDIATSVKKEDGEFVELTSKDGFTLSADNGKCRIMGLYAPVEFRLKKGAQYRVVITDEPEQHMPSRYHHHFDALLQHPTSMPKTQACWTDGVCLDDEHKKLSLGERYHVYVEVLSMPSELVFTPLTELKPNLHQMVAWMRSPSETGGDVVVLAAIDTDGEGLITGARYLYSAENIQDIQFGDFTHFALPMPPAFKEDPYVAEKAILAEESY